MTVRPRVPPDLEVPDDLWNEEGSRVWIRYDLCKNAGKARYKAWTGDGLPIGFREESMGRLIDLRVRVTWAREAPNSEWDKWPWKECTRADDGAMKFWEVSCA